MDGFGVLDKRQVILRRYDHPHQTVMEVTEN